MPESKRRFVPGRHVLRRVGSALAEYIWAVGDASYYCPYCRDYSGGFLRKDTRGSYYTCPLNEAHRFQILRPKPT